MANTKAGGSKACQTLKERYGEDYFKKIGALGGKKSRGGGFADKDLARRAGAIGGRKSKRKKRQA